jgi:CRP-like cAMP-binding protein
VKRLLDRLHRGRRGAGEASESQPSGGSGFFSTMFQEGADDTQTRASWRARALEVSAAPFDRERGAALFAQLWGADRQVMALRPEDIDRLAGYLEFARVPANKEVIGQDELGDYMLIVLEGTLAVDRVQAWGGRSRLAEAHVGDMLGEMSLLDAGARFSSCLTLTPCTLAVVDAARLDQMIANDAQLGVALLASLSRRLSLRLRKVSARLSALLSQT